MGTNKRSKMVKILIISNAILALVIGSVVWVLMKNKAADESLDTAEIASVVERPANTFAASAEQAANASKPADDDRQAAIAAIKAKQALAAQKAQKAREAQAAARLQAEQAVKLNAEQAAKRQVAARLEAEQTAKLKAEQAARLIAEQAAKTQTTARLQAEKVATDKAAVLAAQVASNNAAVQSEAEAETDRLRAELAALKAQSAAQIAAAKQQAEQERQVLQQRLDEEHEKRLQAEALQNNEQDMRRLIGKQLAAASQEDLNLLIDLRTVKKQAPDVGKKTTQQAKKIDYVNRAVVVSKIKNLSDIVPQSASGIEQAVASLINRNDAESADGESSDEGIGSALSVDEQLLQDTSLIATMRRNESRVITVKSGDTLSSISLDAYGDQTLFTKIFAANPQILEDPNLIFPGQVLRVPL